ncbi:hypothetical protein RZR97_07230 [Hydrogenimonas thermophila]|uniref:hypothetical protein n=1 Tax=Hydrogenimonas thermophila TaxID=223786 RepID=UPI0029373542|nr:hypothetical protein [Hydrogenimonas thermophila]WOE68907.1 hypothetical protein RZR91_07265 [Hydrogenimonas thermophila]WOE71414.1 hypothetical protein RZR97_07230 [Hydrogenimonas thermophila]
MNFFLINGEQFKSIVERFYEKFNEKEKKIKDIEEQFLQDMYIYLNEQLNKLNATERKKLFLLISQIENINLYIYNIKRLNNGEFKADAITYDNFVQIKNSTFYCNEKDKNTIDQIFQSIRIITYNSLKKKFLDEIKAIKDIEGIYIITTTPLSYTFINVSEHINLFPSKLLKSLIGYTLLEQLKA